MTKRRSEKTQDLIMHILRKNGGQMSAYDIAAEMREDSPKIAPTTIYRSMSVLVANGLVHRVESKNSFMACQHQGMHETAILSVCNTCGSVDESIVPDLTETLTSVVKQTGFVPTKHVMEVQGVCSVCEPQRAK